MPRQAGVNFENDFSRGLITEKSAIAFPTDAIVEGFDVTVTNKSEVKRRLGFDFEASFTTSTIDRSNKAVRSFLWRGANGSGTVNVIVVQVGSTLHFYRLSSGSVSANDVVDTLDLTTYQVAGSADIALAYCDFAAGDAVLLCVHPSIEPIYIEYDSSTDTVTATQIAIEIRDLIGLSDGLAVDARPTATKAGLTDAHEYNLYNQGWHFDTANILDAWDTARTDMPSNADIWYVFKNSSNAFDTAQIGNYDTGATPAPKGHFILDAFDQDRDTPGKAVTGSAISSIANVTSNNQRPSTVAFFYGRAIFGGVQDGSFAHHVYFSQVVAESDKTKYGKCYQKLDPTSEIASSLLADDGGVINIPGAGTIVKFWVLRKTLYVFSTEGIWAIGGSDSGGFSATDFTVSKISSVNALSSMSFCDVEGLPVWWNNTGIFSFTYDDNGDIQVVDLTIDTIKTHYDTISTANKKFVKGFYNQDSKIAQWLYRVTSSSTPTDNVEYEFILNYNVRRNIFYIWTLPDNVKIHDLLSIPSQEGILVQNTVIDSSSNTVIDSSTNGVIVFQYQSTSNTEEKNFKYLCSYPSGASYKFTWAENNQTSYTDFVSYDDLGEDYSSYFITGYQIPAEGQRFFQTNYVHIFLEQETDASCKAQAIFDWTSSSDSNRWSSLQQLYNSSLTNRNVNFRKLKFRGKGRSIQLRFESVTGKPFTILGWAIYESGNAGL